MRKKIFYWVVILGLVILGWRIGGGRESGAGGEQESSVEIEDQVSKTVSLVIDFGDGEVVEENGLEMVGLSVYEVLERVVKVRAIELDSKQYDFGIFVKGIGGRESNEEMAWIYFVNGEAGAVGADQQILVEGDRVEWKYLVPDGIEEL